MGVQGPEGLLFAGKYKIQKLIGRGGMANVYLAVDINSNVKVAIKIMKPEYASDEEFIRRFDSEAKAVSSLNHSNIVKVFGVGHEGNFRFIVQEYVDGITVKELINQNGHLDWHVAVPIVIQVGLALDYAHKNGIIHRDIKPQNILISRDRIAKVTDFGIARASTGNTITMTSGGALGSVHYFSPEQARGSSVSPASDVYSVGVMLFEMLTGRVPFDGDSNVAIAVKHLQEKAPLASTYVPDIPQGLDSIIQKCMQKVPERRYSTMRQMVTELDALMVDPNGVYGVVSQSGNSNSEGKTSDDVKLNFRQDPSYDKVSDLEKSAEARRRQRLRDNFILALIIVMIVGVIIGLGKLVIDGIKINTPGSVQRGDYEVTNFQGKTIDEVTAELDSYGVKYNIKYVDREDMTPGIVISQSIPPTQKIGSNSLTIIELQVSKSPDAPDYYEIPNYYDVEYSIAVALLRQNGMVTTIVAEETDVVVAGHVIRTEPGFGESVEYGSNVTIYYAADSLIPVPRLQGMRYSEAVAKLGELNLMCSEEPTDSVKDLDKSEWYVIRTDPDPGKEVARNSQIRVYFGTYEDAMRGTTPTPTPAPVKVDVQIEGGVGTVTGAGEYIPGEQVILTAVPSEGYEFDCWKDSNGNILAYSDTYTFTPEENKSYSFTAWFKLGPTPTPGPTSTPTPTPTVAPTSTVTPTPVATATNTPTPTPVPTSTPTPTVAPTNTPTPTPTVAPTNTPTPVPELPPETEATTEATEPVVTETPVPEEEGA